MKQGKRLCALAAAFAMLGSMGAAGQALPAAAKYGAGTEYVEYLNRGISAVSTGSGMLVSWRFNANDPDDAEFRLYRDDELIYTSTEGMATCYLDAGGNAMSLYRVDTLSGGQVIGSEECSMISGQGYFDVPLDVPAGGSDFTYSPNDCSCGDVDNDGEYEIFVKWDPSNSKDNSQSGVTGNVYIDCYRLSGQKLWRINLGPNIRAGAHYTQFLVADFDLDGKAEMTCKTADGTVDGTGKMIGDGSKVYRNSGGYILDGPEYYTLFDGATGAALDTVPYEFPRGTVSKKTWGNGNHNCMPGDLDGDGKQELLVGAIAFDDDGSVLWCTNRKHGDAMHLGDLLPEHPGLEAWVCHEASPFGLSLVDGKTGQILFHADREKDTGRCCAGNVYAGNPGAEFWGALGKQVYNGAGQELGIETPAMNFLCYWDGDLERELLDNNYISKVNINKGIDTLLAADGCASNNGTKATPNLSADLFGDWREEVVLRTENNRSLRIFCTPYTTEHRITTLMHDTQYRGQVASQQTAYNQPPHPSFYLGSEQPLPERPDVKVLGGENPPQPMTEERPAYHMGEVDDFIVADLNHDGVVDIFDLALLRHEVFSPMLTRQDRRRADTEADGTVGIANIIALQKYLLGIGSLKANAEKSAFQYAIDMRWAGAVIEDTNSGYREKAYINLNNEVGSYLEWTFYVPEDGNYSCTFGIANGSQNNRPMRIELSTDDRQWMMDFPTTGAWTTWEEKETVLPLKAGKNRIRMTSATADGGPNFDYLRTAWTDAPAASPVQ